MAFIDTDFVHYSRRFVRSTKGASTPFVQALIDEYRFGPGDPAGEQHAVGSRWGCAAWASSVDRKEFQIMLVEMLEANNIDFVHVEEAD
ncbi:Trifunctional NAD biosynthesis/regulator protein NadR [Leclercia adecarboxylata]|uniref:Trifunctional NAD biosynthesis/regulator protein NadR n=1 Tax=Leclercia adecarboxylata TaxID=83655 RepID=A0A4U9HHU8_9ENTR|nr:Trifunctional NAD biosynthesis/regulator protein NadR [Leclercia adecarboxylata]